MNAFDEVCQLAHQENWCWNLFCTTCGHMHFRYALYEMAKGKTPSRINWIVFTQNRRLDQEIEKFPWNYSESEKSFLHGICINSDIEMISSACSFPDWLGYLGIVLYHTNSQSQSFQELSKTWSLKLAKMTSPDSQIRDKLIDLANGNGLLNIRHLENCEENLMY